MKAHLSVRYKRSGEGDVQTLSVPCISPSDFPYRVNVDKNSDTLELQFAHSMPEALDERGERCLLIPREGRGEESRRTVCALRLTQGVRTGRIYTFTVKVASKESLKEHMARLPACLPLLLAQASTRALRESVRRGINEKFFVETVRDFLEKSGISPTSMPPLPNVVTLAANAPDTRARR